MYEQERDLQSTLAQGWIVMAAFAIMLGMSDLMFAGIKGDFTRLANDPGPQVWSANTVVITLELVFAMLTRLVSVVWYRWLMAALIATLTLLHLSHSGEELMGGRVQGLDVAIHAAHALVGTILSAVAARWSLLARRK